MKQQTVLKIALLICISAVAVMLCICVGSVMLPISHEVGIILHKIFGVALPAEIPESSVSILWTIRLPRALLAFLVGGALAVCGVVTQSVLQNPLASSYTLGVSSGAALGAAVITVLEISVPVLGVTLLPLGGFAGGLLTVLFVIAFATKMDKNVKSHTIVLLGMVVSLFANAIMTLLSVLCQEHEHKLLTWAMGSFNGKRWYHVGILLGASVIGLAILMRYHKEMDIISFGDAQAMSIGVDASKVKKRLILISSLLTGVAVCFVGIVGFVDLIAPHVTRKIFGAKHGIVLPMSFLLGGVLMCLSDLVARVALAPLELPVGAVTAMIGAPFFLWIYFGGGEKKV